MLDNLRYDVRLSNTVQWLAVLLVFLGGAFQIAGLMLSAIILIILGGSMQIMKFFFDRKIYSAKIHETAVLQRNITGKARKFNDIENHDESIRTLADKKILLTRELQKLKGEKILITSVLGNEETYYFADQLKTVFYSAGWQVSGVHVSMFTEPQKGMIIVMNEKLHEDKARYLLSVFKSAGLNFHIEVNENQCEDLGILVGEE